MKTQNFIQFNQKNSTVELTLSFRVNETESGNFVPKHELTMHSFSEILAKALVERMKHCQDILTTQILPQTDKVFTEHAIWSNTVGKHFSLHAYKAMENALRNLESFNYTGKIEAFLCQLTRLEAQQCFKALATMNHDNIRPELYSECVDAIAEAVLVNN